MKKKLSLLIVLAPLALVAATSDNSAKIYYTQTDINFVSSSISLDTFDEYQANLNNSKLNSLVTWGSSDLSVAYVSKTGVIQTFNEGTAIIKATYGELVSTCVLTVKSSNSVPIVKLSEDKISLFPGDTYKINAEVYFKGQVVDASVKWKAENDSILVSGNNKNATIKALDYGTSKVYASIDYKGYHSSSVVEINVKDDASIDLTNVGIKDQEYTINVNKGQYFEVKPVVYLNGIKTNEVVTFTSEDALIARSFDTSVQGISEGSTYIILNYKNVVTLKIRVNVIE